MQRTVSQSVSQSGSTVLCCAPPHLRLIGWLRGREDDWWAVPARWHFRSSCQVITAITVCQSDSQHQHGYWWWVSYQPTTQTKAWVSDIYVIVILICNTYRSSDWILTLTLLSVCRTVWQQCSKVLSLLSILSVIKTSTYLLDQVKTSLDNIYLWLSLP